MAFFKPDYYEQLRKKESEDSDDYEEWSQPSQLQQPEPKSLPKFKQSERANEPDELPYQYCHHHDGYEWNFQKKKLFREMEYAEEDLSAEDFAALEPYADARGLLEVDGSPVIYPYAKLVLHTRDLRGHVFEHLIISAADGKQITINDLASQFNREVAPRFFDTPHPFLESIDKDGWDGERMPPGYYVCCYGS